MLLSVPQRFGCVVLRSRGAFQQNRSLHKVYPLVSDVVAFSVSRCSSSSTSSSYADEVRDRLHELHRQQDPNRTDDEGHFRQTIGDAVAEVRRKHILEAMKQNSKPLSVEERVRMRNTSAARANVPGSGPSARYPRGESDTANPSSPREAAQRLQAGAALPDYVQVVER
mmetsp:Transcript_49156/g.123553  ORF Transcript_49156/g.123553 Transcript_49156/m.123553 type:complete len:169 (-) Transcript_49156:116-622(-)|eukprot:CAMPEP_0177654310 /NCGR_PEP_ID=MMETSP0447-20121125/14254_1 /TAXON_ID=0 /ORGANISM="Stygamoeba regulata, Strain BSH-02190019" /LENGTH=168 /DNA_ID=CAMNT_0019157931 /DNA_START=178 /DNA_END=684 /DNA_ORIENTATION=-